MSATEITNQPRKGPVDPMFHWVLLGLSFVVVGLSALLTLAEGPLQVTIPFFNQPLPPLCSMQRLFGLDCPGCGLTRSFISLAHGQWRAACQFNPAGPFWFALVALQIPYRLLQLFRIQRGEAEIELGRIGNLLLWFALSALLLQWGWRNLVGIVF